MTRYKNFLERVGPYPYSSRLLFLTLFVALLSRYIPIINDCPPGMARVRLLGLVIFNAAWPGLIVAGSTSLLQRYRRWSSKSRSIYFIEVAFVSFLVRFIGFFAEKTQLWKSHFSTTAFARPIGLSLFAGIFFGLFLNAFLNFAQRGTVGKLAQAKEVLNVLEQERRALVKAEEESRAQLASFLHDRIQSDLMTLSIRLKRVILHESDANQALIASTIEGLESLRTSDLRRVIEELTPNFEVASLKSHLLQLSAHHGSTFSVNIQLSPKDLEVGLTDESKLGIYRIFEQLILNSHIHAECKTVTFSLTQKENLLIVDYHDDGIGADSESVNFGSGMAVINSWISVLGAKNKISTKPGSGYHFSCQIPL